jgi:hypothetical protein
VILTISGSISSAIAIYFPELVDQRQCSSLSHGREVGQTASLQGSSKKDNHFKKVSQIKHHFRCRK